MAREKGFKGIVAHRGQVALTLARQYRPTAITLDVFLPDMLGWTVSEQSETGSRHPAHTCTNALNRGGTSARTVPRRVLLLWSNLQRPKIWNMLSIGSRTYVTPHTRRLLVVEDNDIERESIVELLSHDDVEINAVATGSEALRLLHDTPFDCCVVDLRLPDMTGFELLETMQRDPGLRDLPVVVFTGKELTLKTRRGSRSSPRASS